MTTQNTGYMGCQLCADWKGWPAGVSELAMEPKLDGYRLTAIVDASGNTTFHCRDAKEPDWAENLEHIKQAIKDAGFANVMLDGEVMAADWNETAKLVRKHRKNMTDEMKVRVRQEIRFNIFDFVDLSWSLQPILIPGKRNPIPAVTQSLRARREFLMCFTLPKELQVVDQVIVSEEAELMAVYAGFLAAGHEGAVVKHLEAGYYMARTKFWLKMKASKTIDVRVIGLVEGKGKHVGRLGAFTCQMADGTECSVGTGMTDEQREYYWAQGSKLVGKRIEIKMQEGVVASARHPVFLRLRDE